ncbi:TonB-dependent receptor [Hyphomonas sp.]|jgi:iron complex outermembrane receptor protein|uniref:TonB-dependent receptor n=1 Tax=Hyphomonas sp. TaxID=87 RepID=UPI001D1F3623|nr:TonB-dependent receptor [Hyphomonas sp.]
MKLTNKLALNAATGALALALAVPAAQAQQSDDSDSSRRLGKVTVTAQRTEENLQDVPIAVTALSTEQLEDKQVGNVIDLQFQVPNITIGTNSGTANAASITLRGVGETESRGAVEQAVGVYVDGVYIGRSVGSLFEVVDLAQIEVLRGPQGTLYGRNTVGGAVKLTSVKPQFENSGEVRTTIGNNGRLDLRATGNLQLGPSTAVRVTGLMRERDGFFTLTPNGAYAGEGKDVGRKDIKAFRASLRHEFNPDWSLDVAIDSTLDRSDPIPDSIKAGNDADNDYFTIEPLPGTVCAPLPETFRPDGCFTNYNSRSNSRGVSANVNGRFGTFDFTSITAYRKLDDDLKTRVGFPFFQETHQNQFSQEFALASNYDGPFNYVGGVYYFKEEVTLDTVFIYPFSINTDSESYAIFGQGTYDVNDKLSLTGGLRYTQESKNFYGINQAFGFNRTDDADYENVSYTVNADYRLNDAALLYAKYSTGFKSGGWSADAFSATAVFKPVAEETLGSFEVGAKTDISDSVRLNLSAFRNKYDDIQISATIPNVGFTRFNVNETQTWGGEAELVWQVNDAFQFNANLGLLGGEFTDVTPDQARGLTNNGSSCPTIDPTIDADIVKCAKNLEIKNAPSYKGSVGVSYTRRLTEGELIVNADVGFQDDMWTLVAAAPPHILAQIDPLIDARIKYESDAGWSVALWGKNLTDQKYYRVATAGSFATYPSDPITYGIDLGYKF